MERAAGTVFRDAIFAGMLGLLAILFLLLPHLNPPKQNEEEDTKRPGSLMVEIRWPDELSDDVDLWVQGPDGQSVGYSNKGGKFLNLLRDDLGKSADVLNLNYENTVSRGLPDGEYTVAVHHYRGDPPVPVRVKVTARREPTAPIQKIHQGVVTLERPSEEITVVRFKMRDGKLVPGSQHSLPKPIRS